MKKRVLQLIGSFHNGGSERQAVALACALRAGGEFDVEIAVLDSQGVLRNQADAAGFADIQEFPLTSFYDLNFFRQVRRCAKHLGKNRIDLIHTHDFYTNVFGMAAATLAGTKAKIASKRETSAMRSRAQEFVENLAFKRANRVVGNSHAVSEHLRAKGVANSKVIVIHNGIDASVFERRRPKSLKFGDLTLNGGSRVVTLVANLRHEVKNVPMFLRAARSVAEREPNAQFVIAGEGDLRPKLEVDAGKLGLKGNVHFIGRCDDVATLLAGSDVCVSTSTAEGFSNSILEYMAAGRPVIATNVGGAAEAIVDGENGYLISSNDDGALVEKVIELLNDEKKAVKFGKNARSTIAGKFSRETQLSATIELYNSLL